MGKHHISRRRHRRTPVSTVIDWATGRSRRPIPPETECERTIPIPVIIAPDAAVIDAWSTPDEWAHQHAGTAVRR